MGDQHEPTQQVAEGAPPDDHAGQLAETVRPAEPARDITVPAADPFASTLTVAVGPAPAGPRLEPGRELGPVRLVREIGRGATGTVFQGHHVVLGRDVAVKFLVNVTAGPGDAEGLRRFVDEARAAASVRHPNLTQVFHADLDGTTPYLVLEYVQGPTLRQVLDHAGEMTVPVTAAVLGDVASAVAELHARGIIHRDIKPSNVLVDKEGRVFVTDFGLALRRSHTAGAGPAADIEFAGTPAYMAGEMFEGRVSSRSDVYALGVMAFQMLSGSTPYSGTFHELRDKHLREPLPVEALRCRGVKPEVIEVIERATNKQAMFRYKTAPDFARAFREAAACGVPELARARKRLCDLVLARAAGSPVSPAGGAVGGSAGADIRLPYRAANADDDSGSSLYTETISRIATIKRERRRHPPGEGEGSSTRLPPGGDWAVPVPTATASEPTAAPVAPGVVPFAGEAVGAPSAVSTVAPGAARDEAPPARPPVPGAVLTLGVLGILYGTLAAVWQVGVLCGATDSRSWLPPVSEATVRIYLFLVPAAIVHVVVAALIVPGSIGCLMLRRWGRRMLVGVSAADLVLQCVVLLAGLLWVGPATAGYWVPDGGDAVAAGAARSAHRAALATRWIGQALLLGLFPAAALAVMTRRTVRETFDAAAAAAAATPYGEGEDPEPFF
jgi:serine/threonine protein kinase